MKLYTRNIINRIIIIFNFFQEFEKVSNSKKYITENHQTKTPDYFKTLEKKNIS